MRFLRMSTLAALAALAACSEAPIANAVAETAPSSATADSATVIQTEAGRYLVDLNPKLDTKSLPSNADLKILDGDLAQYAVKLCSLDFKNKLRPDRCEVFVQPDKTGFLFGYATLQQAEGVRISTKVETDPARSGIGCFVEGVLENSGDDAEAKLDISKSFESRLPYYAWEKSPGDWMVSPTSDESLSAGGMWYVERENNKLRISQERWNYCYRDSKVYIDEVFTQAVTLTRVGD